MDQNIHLLDSGMVLCRRVIRTFGYGESEAERLLGDLTARGCNPEVGITASEAVISLWVTSRAQSADIAQQMCESTMKLICERLGESVYAEGHAELHEVVAELLIARNQKIALLEGSTTGGLMSLWMTETNRLCSVVEQARVITGAWDIMLTSPLESSSSEVATDGDWARVAQTAAVEILADQKVDFVVLASPHEDQISESGVTVRRGQVAVAARGSFHVFDASMSGNLAIFRQRAARTALNRLRLQLLADG